MSTYVFTASVNICAPDLQEATRQFNVHYAGVMIQQAIDTAKNEYTQE